MHCCCDPYKGLGHGNPDVSAFIRDVNQLTGHRLYKLVQSGESVMISEWKVKGSHRCVRVSDTLISDEINPTWNIIDDSKSDHAPAIAFILDGPQFDWICKNLNNYKEFRQRFVYSFFNYASTSVRQINKVSFVILYATVPVIDKLGSMLSNSYVSTRCEWETALSWLSTLGGAFSALGDLSTTYAEEAAQVSLKQLKIAWKMQDPLIESRCRLYMAISLMQRGALQIAKRMVEREYKYALSLPEGMDPRLRRMCLGVWAKLQYAYTLHNVSRRKIAEKTAVPFRSNGKCSNGFTETNNKIFKSS